MKLVAMMVVRNEWSRYLPMALGHLLPFCDEIRVLDDASTDGWQRKAERALGAKGRDKIKIVEQEASTFFDHEGRTRQRLLEWTMEAEPTHILAIDADEFVTDGDRLRRLVERNPSNGVYALNMQEVWGASERLIKIRQDGGWKEHPVGVLFAAPQAHEIRRNRQIARLWRMPDKALACGRVPMFVTSRMRGRMLNVGDLLHFGWACEKDRAARHQRYVVADGGQYHRSTHLDSIMWGDNQVKVTERKWPPLVDKPKILARANRGKLLKTTS